MLDWIWDVLVAPWPDLEVGTFEIRDLLNVAVAGIGLYLARVAVVISREQRRQGEKQTLIAEQQYEILQTETARETRVSPWAFYDDVPEGWFALTVWGWSVAPIVITDWKLVIRMSDVSEVEVVEAATSRPLPVEPYSGPFMPRGTPVNWQVVGRSPVTIPAGDNNYVRFATGRIVPADGLPGGAVRVSYEMTTKYRKYLGTGKDAIKVELPHPKAALDDSPVEN